MGFYMFEIHCFSKGSDVLVQICHPGMDRRVSVPNRFLVRLEEGEIHWVKTNRGDVESDVCFRNRSPVIKRSGLLACFKVGFNLIKVIEEAFNGIFVCFLSLSQSAFAGISSVISHSNPLETHKK